MFAADIWGTVSDWTGALLTGASVGIGVAFYIFDRLRDRRAQAGSVLVWLHPTEHGPPWIKMQNFSDKPVFDYGFIVASRSKRRVARALSEDWSNSGPFSWPPNNDVRYLERFPLTSYNDGRELYLESGQPDLGHPVEHMPALKFSPAVYDFYVYFRDGSGKYWVIDARTHKPWASGNGSVGTLISALRG